MNSLVYLKGTIIEVYDDKLADITVNNPDNDWSEKEEDNVGGEKE